MNEFERELARDMGAMSRDPLKWVMYAFPWEGTGGPSPWQSDTLSYIRDNLSADRPLRVAVSSGHGIGKSALVAWIILWGMSTCPDTRVVVTANTGMQLKTKTWAELAKWHRKFIARSWFDVGATSLIARERGHEMTWRADSIVWSKHNSEAFAGLHNEGRRIIVIFDEASAVDDVIWEVSEGAMTDSGTEVMWFCFGNPTRNTGRFRECFRKHQELWRHTHVDSRDVEITNKALIAEWIKTYGEDSDFVKVRVKGEFPDVSDTQLIGVTLVREAMARRLKENQIAYAPKIIGIDVAGTGGDCSCLWMRQGLWARRLFKRNIKDTRQFSDICASIIEREKPDVAFIDMGAMGQGVYDNLKGLGYGHIVRPVFFGGGAIDDSIYVNRRSEMWHKMKLWLDDGGTLPDKSSESQDIEDDLTAPEYFYNTRGKMQLESKDDMKARGLRSPDDGDSLALTFAAPVAVAVRVESGPAEEYDPFAHGENGYNPYERR